MEEISSNNVRRVIWPLVSWSSGVLGIECSKEVGWARLWVFSSRLNQEVILRLALRWELSNGGFHVLPWKCWICNERTAYNYNWPPHHSCDPMWLCLGTVKDCQHFNRCLRMTASRIIIPSLCRLLYKHREEMKVNKVWWEGFSFRMGGKDDGDTLRLLGLLLLQCCLIIP